MKTQTVKTIVMLILIVSLINLVSAIQINSGTIYQTTGACSINITFISTAYSDTIILENTSISFLGFTRQIGGLKTNEIFNTCGTNINDSSIRLIQNIEITSCNSATSMFISYIALLGLVGTILLFGWIMAYLFGLINKDAFNKINMVGGIVTLILIGILLIVSIFILSTLCGVF